MTKKQSSWIWFIVAIMPIALYLMSYIQVENTGNLDFYSAFENMGFYVDYNVNEITPALKQTTIYFNEPYTETLEYLILQMQIKLISGNANYFVPQYIAYLIRLYIMKIAFDVFLLLPKICNRLINKAIGSGEVE